LNNTAQTKLNQQQAVACIEWIWSRKQRIYLII